MLEILFLTHLGINEQVTCMHHKGFEHRAALKANQRAVMGDMMKKVSTQNPVRNCENRSFFRSAFLYCIGS